MNIVFMKNDEEIKQLAIFVSQLIREGVTFLVENNASNYLVRLTGGF